MVFVRISDQANLLVNKYIALLLTQSSMVGFPNKSAIISDLLTIAVSLELKNFYDNPSHSIGTIGGDGRASNDNATLEENP